MRRSRTCVAAIIFSINLGCAAADEPGCRAHAATAYPQRPTALAARLHHALYRSSRDVAVSRPGQIDSTGAPQLVLIPVAGVDFDQFVLAIARIVLVFDL